MKILWKCPVCGIVVTVDTDHFPVHCRCDYVQYTPNPGLGDMIAAGLHVAGITPERYVRLKRWVGLRPKCKCLKRQHRLNEIGRALGIGCGTPHLPRSTAPADSTVSLS